MLIKSPLASSWSGSVAGLVGSHNAGGLYLRARTIPVNPNTTPQQNARSSLSGIVGNWGALTDAQRQAWRVYSLNVPLVGPLGDPRNVGGIGMYVRSNVPRLTASLSDVTPTNLSRIDAAPTTFDMGSFTPASMSIASSIFNIAFDNTDAWANEDEAAMLIQFGRPVNPSRLFYKAPFRYGLTSIIAGDDSTPPTSPFTGVPAFAAVVGQRQYARLTVVRADGRVSASQIVSAVAT